MARKKRGPGRVTPKGTRPRNWSGGGAPQLPHVRQEPDLIVEVRQALRADGPFEFLTYVSALAGASDKRMLDPFERRDDPELPDLASLIDMFADVGSPETNALVVGLSQLACTKSERSRAAAHVAHLSAEAWVALPRWLVHLSESRATGATSQHDHGGDFSYEILEIDVAGYLLVMMMNVDHNAARSMFDGYAAPAAIETVIELAEQSDELDMIYSEVSLQESAARIAHAIDSDLHTIPRCESETWPASRALFDWAVRLAGPADRCAFDYEELDQSVQDEYEERFLRSKFGRTAAKTGATAFLDLLWWYSSGYGHGQPLIWGPQRAWIALTDWFPRKVHSGASDEALFPVLLRAWIEFAHDETGVPSSYTEYVFEAIDDAEPHFFNKIAARGSSNGEWDDDIDDDFLLHDDVSFEELIAQMEARRAPNERAKIAKAVGEDAYETFSVDALPEEGFNATGIALDIVPTLDDWVHEIGRVCDALFDAEVQTACLRFLRRIALGDPKIFRRDARVDRGVVALVWSIATANGLFLPHEVDDGPRVKVADLTDFFDAPKSGHTSRADTLLKAVGLVRTPHEWSLYTADPALLTGAHRRRLAVRREKYRED